MGTAAEAIQRLHNEKTLEGPVGMVLLAHSKPTYASDFKLCERLGLIGRGTVLVADDMLFWGTAPYAKWVRASVAEKREMEKSEAEKGDPNLLYTTRRVEGGIDITECVGI